MNEALGPDLEKEAQKFQQQQEAQEQNEKQEKNKYPFDGGVIVFGHGYSDRNWQLSAEAKMRVIGAYQLYKEGLVPRIILTGGAPSEKDKENAGDDILANSEQMAKLLKEKFHVPDEAIITESRSLNTIENTAHALTALEEKGLPTDNFITVSNGYHMDRINEIMKRFNLQSQPVSAESSLNNRALEHAQKMKQSDIDKGLSAQEIEKNFLMRKGRYDRAIQRITRTNEQIQNEIRNESKWLGAMKEVPGYWIPQTLAVKGDKLKEVIEVYRSEIEDWLKRHPDIGVTMDDLIEGNFDYKELVQKGREVPN